VDALKFMLDGDAASPYQRQSSAVLARERAATQVVARLHGPRLSLFRQTLGWAQRYAPLREDALSDVGLGWPLVRQMLQEIGRRLAAAGGLDTAGEIYWLRADEMETAARALDAGRPVADYRPFVAARHAKWETNRAVTPPLALPHGEGIRFLGIDWTSLASARPDQAEGDTLRGTGTSPGRVLGAGRVIHGPEEFGQLGRGDILVAKITTPAWTPLFMIAGGVVTDVGGPLSHGSIVAREYHIPAVMGAGVATSRIQSGDTLAVDGDAGTVTIVQPDVPWRWPKPETPARQAKARRRWFVPLVAGVALLGALLVVIELRGRASMRRRHTR
jgi:pyruvate,water dikinase